MQNNTPAQYVKIFISPCPFFWIFPCQVGCRYLKCLNVIFLLPSRVGRVCITLLLLLVRGVGEEGQDAGGLLREWYIIISREIFNPMYALFCTSPGDRVTYTINPSSHCNSNHLSYFKFVGRMIAKAVYDNKLLECYFTRSFYKHILGVLVKYVIFLSLTPPTSSLSLFALQP